MKHAISVGTSRWGLLVGLGSGLLAGSILFPLGAPAQAPAAEALPDAPGKETFDIICNTCHDGATAVFGKQWTWTEWDLKVTEMLQEFEVDFPLEPPVTEDEFDAIVGYLASSFPPPIVHVNSLTAKDLEFALGLSTESAEAIVREREANGPIETLDALREVPGLNAAEIETKADRLVFE